nr:integrase, catalytic region, zinc finger, CCHC-type, peptidase aspartic, catalytic [Tanacetum cinerariifolium]
MVAEDDETSKDKEIDKLMALISLSSAGYENQRIDNVAGAGETVGSTVVQKCGIQCYNCKEFRHVARECQKPKRVKDAAYHREKMLLCNRRKLEFKVSPDAADSGPISDDEPLQKVSNDDHYNVFSMESAHPEQSKPVHDTYPIQQDAQNVIIDSLDTSYDREEIDQNDDDDDLAKECELLASLIEKLKYEIDESKNCNKFLETSNKVLIEKLKGEIKDFKNKNKSLESSNNSFKEANNRLFETNNLLSADYKKSEAKLARRNSKEYASQMELECAKVRGDFLSYKMDYQKSCTKYTDTINALNQMILEMKDKLSVHQETISILSQQKEAQIKLYKTQEDKDLDKVIELENKVKVLDNIVYKTGFYNDNLALMLAPDSDEVICLEKESRSKLSDLIMPLDYDKLNNLCLNEEMVADLRYFNSLELEVDSLRSQLETQKTQFLNEIDRLSRQYYYADHMNAILGVYTELDEDLKAQLQEKGIVISELKKLIEKLKGKSADTNLNAKTFNVKSVSTMCDKCVLIDEHAMCVLNSVDKPIKKTVDSKSNKKPRNFTRKLYERVSKTCVGEIVLFIIDFVCSKHMMENLKLLINFVEKFLGMVKFGNDQIAPILGYGDLVQSAVTIKRVYYVEGLNNNLFSVDQICDADLEVAFRKSMCFIRNLKGNDLLTSSRGIFHQTSVARTLEQNGVVERRNRTLVKAARTMLRAAKVPLLFWAEAIATACFTQNRSLVIPRHEKTPYHIINDRKPFVKFFHIFGSICYIVRNGKNLDKMKEKGDECIFVSLSPAIQRQANVPQADRTVTTSNELDLLFSLMFDELLNGSSKVVSKSSDVSAADAPNQRQQLTTPLNIHTKPAPTCQVQTLAPTVTSSENIYQAETYAENDQVADDEFINIFSTPVQDQGETSSRHVDSSKMHTFYQRYPSKHRWTKDHPLEQVIGNPSQSVRTRCQLESDAEMCMFALTVSRTEPKNIKEAIADSAWIESMQEELYQFDRLDV